MKRLLVIALLTTASPVAAQTAPLPADSLERARTWTRWFTEGQIDSLFAVMVPGGNGPMSSRESLAQVQQQFRDRAGRVTRVVEEQFTWRGGARQYRQVMETELLPEAFVLRWVMQPDGKIHGMGLGPISAAPPADSSGPVIKRP